MRQCLALASLGILSLAPALAAIPAPLSPELQVLDKAVGTWSYQGENRQTAYTKAGKWTWDMRCAWSANRLFLVCSFVMNWPEGTDHSVSISTYNGLDKAYWHYEVLDDEKGSKPVISRMTVAGDTWTDTTENVAAGSKAASHYRVVYQYPSPGRSAVRFQISNDGMHWTTLGEGTGLRQKHP